MTGVPAVYAFSRAVALLGAGRAAMFPAMVPALAVLFGIPVASEWPEPQQWLGLGVVMAGLPLAMGLLRRWGAGSPASVVPADDRCPAPRPAALAARAAMLPCPASPVRATHPGGREAP